MPEGFVFLKDKIPDAEYEIRYGTTNNFTGHIVDGYFAPKAILTQEAATHLESVQKELYSYGLSLKIFDAYRPQMATEFFERWENLLDDQINKKYYYPNTDKIRLFKDGYISRKSGHTRGSTVDVTLGYRDTKGYFHELDMGGTFDLFDQRSWEHYPYLTGQQRANRLLLRTIMEKNGFVPYKYEWWHFTLKNEPYPNTYFNFPIK